MRRGRRTKVIACLVFLSSITGGLVMLGPDARALTPHDEIVINGNNDFISANGVVGGSGTPSDPYIIEGWEIAGYTGISISNSQVNFVVRNVYISSRNYGIALTNVNNGRIENATIEGSDYGIQLDTSNDNFIVDNHLIGSQWTLLLMSSHRNLISNNEFSGYGQWNIDLFQSHENLIYYNSIAEHRRGMYITESNDNRVSYNTISGGSWGMTITKTLRNVISHNVLPRSGMVCLEIYGGDIPNSDNLIAHNMFNECPDAIFASQVSGSDFSYNTFTNSSNGISLSHSNGNDVFYNTAIDNSRGLYLTFSNDNIFVGNELITNGAGIVITNSDPNIIYHNNILGNTIQAYDDGVYDNRWDAGYPAGGNYWSDYGGQDNCSGPLQDICPDPDGIGDAAYVDGHVNDRYPLMELFFINRSSPPTKPLNLQAVGGTGSISLIWDKPSSNGGSPITNYQVFRGTGSGELTFLIEIEDVLSYTDQGLEPDQTYYYQVAAVNSAGVGLRSNEASAKPNGQLDDPLVLIPHDPIYIYGDEDFKHVHGVTGGSGTYSDPYIIEGWSINASTATGINISYANVCFSIRNVYIYGGGPSHFGISLSYAMCGETYNVTVTNNQIGGYLYRSYLAVFESNVTSNLREGIYGYESSIHVENSNLTHNGGCGLASSFTNFVGTVLGSNATSNGGCGIAITGSAEGSIDRNNVSLNDLQGIVAELYGSDSSISDNFVYGNGGEGILLFSGSRKLRIENNTVSHNHIGMTVEGSECQISNNLLLDNDKGIYAFYGRNNLYFQNIIMNPGVNMHFDGAPLTTLLRNEMGGHGIQMDGYYLRDWNTMTIDASNTVRGRPVFYLSNAAGGSVLKGYAQIILGNCTGMTIDGHDLENVYTGINLGFSSSNIIKHNKITGGQEGIKLDGESRDNVIQGNNLEGNTHGVWIDYYSESNSIYHNNFIESGGRDGSGSSSWDNSYPSGGNYWSSYGGVDECSGPNQDVCPDPDRIGDTPHIISGNSKDNYPSMAPFRRFTFNPPFSLEAVASSRPIGDVTIHETHSELGPDPICCKSNCEPVRPPSIVQRSHDSTPLQHSKEFANFEYPFHNQNTYVQMPILRLRTHR